MTNTAKFAYFCPPNLEWNMKTKKHVDIITMGCSKNLVDSEILLHHFEENGYTIHHDPEKVSGGIAIVNTCGFIGDAKEESVNMILQLAEAKQDGKIEQLYVMGCLSQRYNDELIAEIPEIDGIYGKFDWRGVVQDINADNILGDDKRVITTPKHYAYIKISEGCNRACAYCAIPIITGKHISRPIEEIINEVTDLVNQGVKEFQIIAQDLSYYGIDIYKENRLAQLIEAISDIKGVEWIRLHYAYPTKFPYDLLPVMRERDNVCKYLDIALQHISDPLLKAMKRGINKEKTIALLHRIRKEVPGIFLRTTMMVGFPNETDENFEELCDFVRETKFERLGVFPYSEEGGTSAANNFEDNISEEVKEQRTAQLMMTQENVAIEVAASLIGSTQRVIIDRSEGEYYVGRTQYDSPEVDPEVIVYTEEELTIGQFYNIKITDTEDFNLIGTR